MKKQLIASIMVVSFLVSGCSKNITAVEYNNLLVEYAGDCSLAQNMMRQAIEEKNYTLTKTLYETSLSTCKSVQKSVSETKELGGDASLRDATNALLLAEVAYLEKFGESLIYREKSEDYDFSEADKADYERIAGELLLLQEASADAGKTLLETQTSFSEQHQYILSTASTEEGE